MAGTQATRGDTTLLQSRPSICCWGACPTLWDPNWDLGTCLMEPGLHGTGVKNSWKCVQFAVFFPSYKSAANGKGGLKK